MWSGVWRPTAGGGGPSIPGAGGRWRWSTGRRVPTGGIHLFGDSQRHAKAIRKARDTGEYESAVAAVFRELELLPELRPEW